MSHVGLFSLAALLACARAYEELQPPLAIVPEVTASEGGAATLRCLFYGIPRPKITWRFRKSIIVGDAGRYRLMPDGALKIDPLHRSDAGDYTCVADNGIGLAMQHLAIIDLIPQKNCSKFREECDELYGLCMYGIYKSTQDGCERCKCIENPCATAKCWSNMHCELVKFSKPAPRGDLYSARCVAGGDCKLFIKECNELKHCYFGIKKITDTDGCERCECNQDPCKKMSCAAGERCVVSVPSIGQKPKYTAECGTMVKAGACPKEETRPLLEKCRKECKDDASCRGKGKCCQRGCSQLCLEPVELAITQPPPTTAPAEMPQMPLTTPTEPVLLVVLASEGGMATLRCQFNGNSSSKITWKFRKLTVQQHRTRHRRHDSGLYLPASYVIPGGEGEGPWGQWGEVSPCSRTCGGGVAKQKRICLQLGSEDQPLCTGGDTKYFSCQTQDCPDGSGDFRAEQCAEFNDNNFWGSKYKWVPFMPDEENPCELHCQPLGQWSYLRLKPQVTDGTRCRTNKSLDVCVSGKCQYVGCDMMLNSTARMDKCRVCRGNGTDCRTTTGIIDSQDLIIGYNDILLIPTGSTSISIEEVQPSNNYLALRTKNGTFYLNGNYHIDLPKTITFAGTLWTYERSQPGFTAQDKLRCLGPTTEPLYLSLLHRDRNVGIRYEYSVPDSSAPPTGQRYNWVHEEFTPCSATCGGGFQVRNVACETAEQHEIVHDILCDKDLKPTTNQTCSPDPCPPVTCPKIITNGIKSIVPDKECIDLMRPEPEEFQICDDGSCPALSVGHWRKIYGNTGRYRIKLDGALEIVSLDRNDTGAYICVDDNGPGAAAQEVHLFVNKTATEPIETGRESKTNKGITDVIRTSTVDPCSGFEFGCCADNETEASGPNGQGCPCNATEFGCCPDGVSPALDFEYGGCQSSCSTSLHGCCQDDKTPSNGPDFEDCCLLQPFGCCPDNRKPAEGPHLEGCGCQYAPYGCCPDNVTIAQGPDNQGCGCQYTQHGCCPDRHTLASGPNNEGCACSTYQFGCCADGVTIAQGPDQQGCHCRDSKFGCCGNGETRATGPDAAGCDCSSSQYGCCSDGLTEAAGFNNRGCPNASENKQAACSMSRSQGPCRNFTRMWYFDLTYGGCSYFWYGGCDGNSNRFATQQECKDVCVQPSPKDACKLPSVKGSCKAEHQRWHYNSTRKQCTPFKYGGCLGNANNFNTRELCEKQCELSSVKNPCTLPPEEGNCLSYIQQWYYDASRDQCIQFVYTGCSGNVNRFDTQRDCEARCKHPAPTKNAATPTQQVAGLECKTPSLLAPCGNNVTVFYYDSESGQCLVSGMGGCRHPNSYSTEEECERSCGTFRGIDVCGAHLDPGPCRASISKIYWDAIAGSCQPYAYGGCAGGPNRFSTVKECMNVCGDTGLDAVRMDVKIIVNESIVEVGELDSPLKVRCQPYGHPPLTMSWYHEGNKLLYNDTVYELRGNVLLIKSLAIDTLGYYICQASYGEGKVVSRGVVVRAIRPKGLFSEHKWLVPRVSKPKFTRPVDAVRMDVKIIINESIAEVGELDSPLKVRCQPYGHPPLTMSWYHEGNKLLYNDTVYELRGNVLLIKSLAIDTLGHYTCQANYGEGEAVSRAVVVRAYKPKGLFNNDKFLVPARAPGSMTQPPSTSPTTTEVIRPVFYVPVSTQLVSTPFSTLNIGITLYLTCDVDGYPEPDVRWTKDGAAIRTDNRITITIDVLEALLTVKNVSVADSGLYACHARNPYSSQSDTVQINVKQLVVPAKCTDHSVSSNCSEAGRRFFCEYLSRFCCKSCLEAGQLDPQVAKLLEN